METFTYEWEWRTQTNLPPPQKTFGSNTGGWAGAKSLYASSVNYAALDVSPVIRQMTVGDIFRIEHKTDSSIWAEGVLAVPPVEYSGFFTFPVSAADGVGAPVNNQVYRVILKVGVIPPVPEGEIPEPVFLATCHGYGDSIADTLYAICKDGSTWVRSIRRDHGWVEIDRQKEPLVEPVKEPKL